MPNRLSSTAICLICSKDFHPLYTRKGQLSKYCSRKCSYRARDVERTCPTCNKVFTTNLVSMRKDYCSRSCIEREPCQLCGQIITGRKKYQSGPRRYCSRKCANIVNRTLPAKKNYWTLGYAACLKRHGTLLCERCGFDVFSALVVHHVNHDHQDLRTENLIVLCANCHTTDHWPDSKAKEKRLITAKVLVNLTTALTNRLGCGIPATRSPHHGHWDSYRFCCALSTAFGCTHHDVIPAFLLDPSFNGI